MSITISPSRTWPIRRLATILALGAVWVAILALGLWLGADRLLLGTDGRYCLTLGTSRVGFEWPWFSDSIDFLHGIGDQLFPIKPEVIPFYRIWTALGSGNGAKVAGFLWVGLELIAAVVFLARSIGLTFSTGIGASAVTLVCMMPLWKFGATYSVVHIGPWFDDLVAVTSIVAGLYLRIGRTTITTDLFLLAGLAAALVWFVLASPLSFMLPAPLLCVTFVVGLCAAGDARERLRKLAAVSFLLLLAALGPAWYLLSEVTTSAAFVFNVELQNSLATWRFASIIFHGLMGPILVASAVTTAVIYRNSKNRTLRFFGYGIITYLTSRLTFAWLTITFDFWRGPAPIYFELFVVPLYCIFAWLLWERAAAWVTKNWLKGTELPVWFSAYAGAVILALAVGTGNHQAVFDPYAYPPRRTAIVTYLVEHAQLLADRPFAGRVATMTGLPLGPATNWFDLLGKVDFALAARTGNDHRQSGLRYFRIPVLFEYSPMATAPFYALTTRLLGYSQDTQVRNVQVLRRVEPRILAMLGVRYVITDAPVIKKDMTSRATVPLGDAGALNLYEVARPNLGDYSPTRTLIKTSATQMLEELAKPDFDPTVDVLLDTDATLDDLVPATNARMIFEGAQLHITADSIGRSLLLLPLQYSHCLVATSANQPSPQLLRANLAETAVLFEGHVDARIELRVGPFLHPLCRFSDSADDKRLQVGQVPRQIENAK